MYLTSPFPALLATVPPDPDPAAVQRYLQFEAETGRFDFSGDEGILLIIGGALSLWWLFRWLGPLLRVSPLIMPMARRLSLLALPVIALAGLYVVLKTVADPVWVQDRFDYTLLFMLVGGAWLWLSLPAATLLGISPHHDVIASRNAAPATAFAGFVLGLMAVYAGANVGNGASVATTIIPGLVAIAVLLTIWMVLEWIADPVERIRIERDQAAAMQLGGLLLAAGLILGRAVAGDFYSWAGTWQDLATLGWPALLLIPLGCLFERLSRPTPHRPRPEPAIYGFLPAAFLIGAAIIYVVSLGWPEVAPRGEYAP